MANFKDIIEVVGGGKPGGQMAEDLKIESGVKEKAIGLLDQARDLLDKEGVDGTSFIMSHLGGERAAVAESKQMNADRGPRKALLISLLRKRLGKDEE